jgi:CARDB protein
MFVAVKRLSQSIAVLAGLVQIAGASAVAALDLEAQVAYLRAAAGGEGAIIGSPAIGAQVFLYVDYTLSGTDMPVTAQSRAVLDGTTLCGGETQFQPGAFALFCTGAWTATPGQHTLRWEFDFDNAVAESNETNNAAEFTFASVDPAQFDLQAKRAFLRTAPDQSGVEVASPSLGQPVYFYTEYLLAGTDFPVTSSVRSLLDDEVQCSGVNQLDVGAGNLIYCTAPWTAMAGTHTLRWEFDVDGLLPEVNEDNNAAQLMFTTGAVTGCAGDCNDDAMVGINELITGVNIALGAQPITACAAFDANHDQMVGINELIAAVNNALNQCA